jgi:hypothetical protein
MSGILDAEEALHMISDEYETAAIEIVDHQHHFFKVLLTFQDCR